ncbi:MAG: beta-galactosidase [Candidatus Omnitrophica bacterium]|nr:beta-galactosidase [Candidatus Omnitrophota bacterium]
MDSPFGVLEFLHWNHCWNNYKYPGKEELKKALALMQEAGINWVRIDFLWSDIEPKPGKFEFAKYDTIVDLLTKAKINILGILDYSADWASSCGRWNCPPKENKLFVNYASKVVGRYKDRIKYWEVWNEPDSSVYWIPQDNLKTYCGLLKDTYLALKKIDPECKILNGGLAGELSSINKLYDAGAKDYFDILSIHIFDSPLNPTSLKRISAFCGLSYKVMSRNGDGNKKIWITEIGCPGVKKGLKVNPWWMGVNPAEKQQAEWLKEVYRILLKDKNVEKIFWAFFRDCNQHWDNGIDYFGLVRWDFSKKPAFFAYRRCVNYWRKKQPE